MDESKTLLGKVERIEHHFQVYKNDMEDVKGSIKDLKTAIIGNDVNGNKGFLHLLNEIGAKVDNMEQKNILLEENMRNVKFISRGFIMGLIGFIFWLFQKN